MDRERKYVWEMNMSEFATVCLKLIAEHLFAQIFYTDRSFQIKNTWENQASLRETS